jgi:hypothetical protein
VQCEHRKNSSVGVPVVREHEALLADRVQYPSGPPGGRVLPVVTFDCLEFFRVVRVFRGRSGPSSSLAFSQISRSSPQRSFAVKIQRSCIQTSDRSRVSSC